ncbi:hypothetical protein GCM10028791_27640 [Echinicola sediminis]
MTKYFTLNEQLIRYIYQDMSEAESEDFERVLHRDGDLMQDYLDFLSTIDQLKDAVLEPSEKVVKAIKSKAKFSGLEKV